MTGSEDGRRRSHLAFAGELVSENENAPAAFGRAVHGLVGHRADTATALDEALAADPDLAAAHLLRGFGLRVLGRRDLLPAARAALEVAQASIAHRGGERERALAEALAAWLDGRADRAAERLDGRLLDAPEDLLLVKLVHAIRFIMGDARGMLSSIERALPAFPAESVATGFARGCLSFALEENRRHEQAEEVGRHALEINSHDVWALHSVAHVLYERGDVEGGAAWLADREDELTEINNFAGHLAWHEALFLIEAGVVEKALEVHDRRVAIYPPHDYRDVSNAASLLLLLEEHGLDVKDRWRNLAKIARSRLGDHGLAFADIHYVLALSGAGLEVEASEFIESMKRSAGRRDRDFDAEVLLDVGAPLADAILDARAGRLQRATETVRRLGPSIGLIGGSRAQRRVIPWVCAPQAVKATVARNQAIEVERMYEILRILVLAWGGIGLPLALIALGPGLGRPGLGAAGASLGFRLMVLPAAVLLWPLLLRALLEGEEAVVTRNLRCLHRIVWMILLPLLVLLIILAVVGRTDPAPAPPTLIEESGR